MNFSTYILIPTLKKHSCAQTFKFTCKTAHKIQFQFQQKVTSCKWIHALHKEPLINANLKAGNQKTEKLKNAKSYRAIDSVSTQKSWILLVATCLCFSWTSTDGSWKNFKVQRCAVETLQLHSDKISHHSIF